MENGSVQEMVQVHRLPGILIFAWLTCIYLHGCLVFICMVLLVWSTMQIIIIYKAAYGLGQFLALTPPICNYSLQILIHNTLTIHMHTNTSWHVYFCKLTSRAFLYLCCLVRKLNTSKSGLKVLRINKYIYIFQIQEKFLTVLIALFFDKSANQTVESHVPLVSCTVV